MASAANYGNSSLPKNTRPRNNIENDLMSTARLRLRLVVDGEDLHVVVGAAAHHELGLAPVAAEDAVRVPGQVVEGSPERPEADYINRLQP
jgi:hypothetical protein